VISILANLLHLDLNLLVVFDLLMQERNLSRAALRLHRSQPAVSNSLARLREQLGQPLFRRTSKGLEPTAGAMALHAPVRQALLLLQAGLGPQGTFQPETERTFKLALNDYGQLRLLPGVMARLKSLAPRVILQVMPDEGSLVPRRLAEGDLDLAIDYLYFNEPELQYQQLVEERLVVIARQGHPAFRNGLDEAAYRDAQHVSILPRLGRGSPLEIVLGSAKVQRHVQLLVPHYLPIPAIVARTDLLGTVPRRLADHFARSYALEQCEVPFPTPAIQVSLIWHKQQQSVPGLNWLKEQIMEVARAESF
jgi:DNA-binding transcriptional LysR family regulator